MVIANEEILKVFKQKGPLVPNDIRKILQGDTMIFGAMLSELASRGFVKISSLKKGSSPFYYLAGQETMLEGLIQFLNPKDQPTVRFLKERKLVRDQGLELFQRVSLRQIKDFAKPLNYQTPQGVLLFWRYYLIPEIEAIRLIDAQFNPKPKEVVQEVVQKVEEKPVEKKAEESRPVQTAKISKPVEPIQIKKEVMSQEQPVEQKPIVQEKPKPSVPLEKKPPQKPQQVNQSEEVNSQQHLSMNPGLEKTPFYEVVVRYFQESDITIFSEEQLSKDREYEFIIHVPSGIGRLKMLCRARNKKKLNEGDVATALLKSKMKDMSCLFLTNGDFSKKSLAFITKEYKGVIIRKL